VLFRGVPMVDPTEATEPGEGTYTYLLASPSPESLQPAVRVSIEVLRVGEVYAWKILETVQVSGFSSARAALDGAWSVFNGIVAAIAGVGMEPTTDRVLAVIRLITLS